MIHQLEIRTLGGVQVLRAGTPITSFDSRKVVALLIYLACNRREYPREVLAEFFWEERSTKRALDNLRVAITSLRDTVEDFVIITRDTLSINPDSLYELDVDQLEERLATATSATPEMLEQALSVYRGDFLEGFYVDSNAFESWANLEREHYRFRVMDTLDRLITLYLERGNYPAGIARGIQLLQMDLWREKTYYRLMQLYALSGERERALETYQDCSRALWETWKIKPSPDTTALYQQIMVGDTLSLAAPVPAPPAPPEPPRALCATSTALVIKTAHDVPSRIRRLIGRDALMESIRTLLMQGERVLLHGFSGMGKTVLAAEAVAAWGADRGGPVLWLVARHEEAAGLLENLARAFNTHGPVAAAAPEQKRQIVRNLLVEQGVTLVVLDDVWNGTAFAEVLEAFPVEMPVLVTSRQRLSLPRILNVGELSLLDALELLSFHAYQSFTEEDQDAVQLCQRLGFHPFALEIAGKTLQVDVLTPRDLLKRLGNTPHNMTMPEWFRTEGCESVKELLDASMKPLDERTRDVFFAFGALFAPSATSDLIALCLDRDPQNISDTLAHLQRRGLAERLHLACEDITVFRVHDLAHSYARVNTPLDGLAVVGACQKYIAHHGHNLDALDIEMENILASAQQAEAENWNDALIEIFRQLAVETGYFDSRGCNQAAIDLMRAAIAETRAAGRLDVAHFLVGKLANIYAKYLGNLDQAYDLYSEALELAYTLGNTTRAAMMLALIGTTRFRQGYDDADIYYAQAYQIATDTQDDLALAFILGHRSYYEGNKQPPDYENSRRYSDEAVQLAIRLGMTEVRFASLINRASSERALGQLDLAIASDQEAYRLAQAHDNRIWLAGALIGLGKDYDAAGNRERAQSYFQEAVDIYHRSGVSARRIELLRFLREHHYSVATGDDEENV